MDFPWDESRRAFDDAAAWFAGMAASVGDRWTEPGLGDVQALGVVADLAVDDGVAGPLLLLATGRPADGFSVL